MDIKTEKGYYKPYYKNKYKITIIDQQKAAPIKYTSYT